MPREQLSRESSSSIDLNFGAPVIEPPGNAALTQSTALIFDRFFPRIVLTMVWTVAYDSTSIRWGTCTEPGSQTRPRSFLRRSTIIKFSAWSFSLSQERERSLDHGKGAKELKLRFLDIKCSIFVWFQLVWSFSLAYYSTKLTILIINSFPKWPNNIHRKINVNSK